MNEVTPLARITMSAFVQLPIRYVTRRSSGLEVSSFRFHIISTPTPKT
jgi:hypothetical protein